MRGVAAKRYLRPAVAVLAGVLLVGCSTLVAPASPATEPEVLPSPSPGLPSTPVRVPTGDVQAAASPRAGWTECEEPGEFAIALPPGWQEVDADSQMLAGALEVLRRQSPELAALLISGGERLGGSELRLLAFDLAPESLASGLPANLSVVRRPVDASTSLAELGASHVRQLEEVGRVYGPVQRETVRLPAGEALRQSYRLSVDTRQGAEFELCLTQLLLLRGKQGYALTLATAPEAQGEYEPVFDEIARSLRWL